MLETVFRIFQVNVGGKGSHAPWLYGMGSGEPGVKFLNGSTAYDERGCNTYALLSQVFYDLYPFMIEISCRRSGDNDGRCPVRVNKGCKNLIDPVVTHEPRFAV